MQSIDFPPLILTVSDDTITTHADVLALLAKLADKCKVVKYAGKHLERFYVNHESKGFGGWYLELLGSFLEE